MKYGRRLRALGEAVLARVDAMGNEEYQRLLRADAGEVRERLPAGDAAIARAIADLDDAALLAALRDLGGHDLGALLEAYRLTTRSPTARRSSSPTRSRAGGCRPRATRATTPRC